MTEGRLDHVNTSAAASGASVTQRSAVDWMLQDYEITSATIFTDKAVQRYALLAVLFGLQEHQTEYVMFHDDGNENATVSTSAVAAAAAITASDLYNISRFGVDECEWEGVVCGGEDNQTVQGIHWKYGSLSGTLAESRRPAARFKWMSMMMFNFCGSG